jgi:RNA polymerase sigma factor (sigma-70 family)
LFGLASAGAYRGINTMIEDTVLLREYTANRTEEAFAQLVRRHLNLVYAAAMRRTGGDPHRSQEIVQLVFNELARRAEKVARHPTLAGWLHAATRNAAINAARADRRRRFYEKEASLMNEILSFPPLDAEWDRLRNMIDEVIDRLPQSDHDAIVLRFLEGHTFAEVGQALQISEDAARMRVDRALNKIRRLLARRGITSSAAALSLGLAGHTGMAAPAGMAATITSGALSHAASAGSAGSVVLWTALIGSKHAVATTGAALLVATGLVTFAMNSQPTQPSPSAPASTFRSSSPAPPVTTVAVNRISPLEGSPASVRLIPAKSARATGSANQRTRMLRNYAPLFDRLTLTPTQREHLVTLLVDEFEIASDYAAASTASGMDPTTNARSFDLSVRKLREGIWDEIETLLGEDGYAEYLKVRQDLRAAAWITELERILDRTANPLSPEQSQRFRLLLGDSDRDPKDSTTLEEASRFLSPEQMAAFRQFQEERIAGSQSKRVQDAVRQSASQRSAVQ